jgi:spermidine synthase
LAKPQLHKTLHRSYSVFSGSDINVFQVGERRVLGTPQVSYSLWSSDENDLFEDRYWGKMIATIKKRIENIDSVLVMGIAGGTLAYLLNQTTSPKEIVGIEIDPEVIKLGKKYFYLDTLSNLTVIQADVVSWLKEELNKKDTKKYDLIVMDLFQGPVTPPLCDREEFFHDSISLLNKGGVLTMNKIFHRDDPIEKIQQYVGERFGEFFDEVSFTRYQKSMKRDNVLMYGWDKLD